MSTFRFNFLGKDDTDNETESKEDIKWLESEEVIPNVVTDIEEKVKHAKMFICGDIEIGHIIVSDAIASIEEEGFKTVVEMAEKEHSDLIAGSYEGGLKIWECTNDLILYLAENLDGINFDKLNVLDLGCGAGILGIYAFKNGSSVTFQDYNKEVIEHVTIPNVLLNIDGKEQESTIKKCKFYSGDWSSFNKILPTTELYDIILTSETIYNEGNYDKLIKLFVERLKEDGVVYVAAKTYYFGVGGGTRQFEAKIEKHRSLKCEVCWLNVGGVQREILKITHS